MLIYLWIYLPGCVPNRKRESDVIIVVVVVQYIYLLFQFYQNQFYIHISFQTSPILFFQISSPSKMAPMAPLSPYPRAVVKVTVDSCQSRVLSALLFAK